MKISGAVIMLMLIAPSLASGQATPQSSPIPSIEVTGNGEVRANPDRATMDVAVETHGATAAQAASENAALSQKIADALKAKLGDTGKIQTGSYNLTQDYQQRQGEITAQIIGYRALNTVSVETTALDRVGPLIDAAIGAGANRIDSVGFTLRDQSGPRNDAIAKAAADALSQARALAAALGVKLKRVLHASTSAEPRPIFMNMGMARMAAAAPSEPTPIAPGQITVPATVNLSYEIE
ncbi:MAG TPA: SIMPL domain-containing protein [Candidatus Binataceae bacterium]